MSRAALLVLAALLAAGCAPTTRVILLPQPSGPGAVTVSTAVVDTQLASVYVQAQVQGDGTIALDQSSVQQLQDRFGPLLALQIPAEQHFTLYFETGGVDLTLESKEQLTALLKLAEQRPGGVIVITGHTDRVGAGAANDALSLQRARAIREMVIGQGFDPNRVEAVGRGEREPAVTTQDGVAEPRNRRTEIIVR